VCGVFELPFPRDIQKRVGGRGGVATGAYADVHRWPTCMSTDQTRDTKTKWGARWRARFGVLRARLSVKWYNEHLSRAAGCATTALRAAWLELWACVSAHPRSGPMSVHKYWILYTVYRIEYRYVIPDIRVCGVWCLSSVPELVSLCSL
jgi:hypothetical protein